MLPLVGASNIASIRDAQSLDVTHTVRCLLELLYVRHGYSSLSLYSRVMLYYCACYYFSVNWIAIALLLCTLCTILIINQRVAGVGANPSAAEGFSTSAVKSFLEFVLSDYINENINMQTRDSIYSYALCRPWIIEVCIFIRRSLDRIIASSSSVCLSVRSSLCLSHS